MKNHSPIKLLVRHPRTSKFLRSTGRWTKRAEAAFNFPTLVNAIHACLVRRMEEAVFVLRFEGDAVDRCLRIRCQ